MENIKKTIIIFLLLLSASINYSQNNQKALIIGISKYSEPDLELSFAHKDAVDFRNYLLIKKNPLDSVDIRMRINEDVTSGNFKGDLIWLAGTLKRNDVLYIFISCHGEAVQEEIRRCFLLLYTAKKDVTKGGDVYRMDDLITYINQLSINPGVKIFLFVDACSSGNLMISDLNQYYAGVFTGRVTKILSCGMEEKSVEKKSIRNGAFTHCLIDGLNGYADENSDGVIINKELEKYLKYGVDSITHGRQIPLYSQETLSDTITAYSNSQKSVFAQFDNTDGEQFKGLNDETGTDSDTSTILKFSMLEQSLVSGQLVEPKGNCAWDLFTELDKLNPEKAGNFKTTLISASINDAQSILNRYLAGGNNIPSPKVFRTASVELKKTIELIGQDHILAKDLIPKQMFLEAYSMADDFSKASLAIDLLKKSIELDPYASYSYNSLADIYSMAGNYELAESNFNKAVEISPKWLYPRLLQARNSLYRGRTDIALKIINEVISLDSNAALAYLELGYTYYYGGIDIKLARQYYQKGVLLGENTPHIKAEILMLIGWAYVYNSDHENAIEYYRKSISADSSYRRVYCHFARSLTTSYSNKNLDSAILLLNKALSYNPSDPEALIFLGDSYNEKAGYYKIILDSLGSEKKNKPNIIQNRGNDTLKILKKLIADYYKAADTTFELAIKSNPRHLFDYLYDIIAKYYRNEKNDNEKALKLMRKAYEENMFSPLAAKNLGDYYQNYVYDNDLAEKIYLEGIKRDPLYMENYLQLRSLYNLTSQFEKEKALTLEIIAKTRSAKFAYEIADELYYKDSLDIAAYWCYKAIELDSTYKNTYNVLAKIHTKNNLDSAAKYISLCNDASLMSDFSDMVMNINNLDSALKYVLLCKDLNIMNDFSLKVIDSANACIEASDTVAAERLYYFIKGTGLINNFKNFSLNYKLFTFLVKIGKKDEAVELINKMLETNLDEITWNKFVTLYVSLMLESGNSEGVIQFYNKNPYPSFITLELSLETSIVLLDAGKDREALDFFSKTFNKELSLKYYLYWSYQKEHKIYQKIIDGVNNLYTKYYELSNDKSELLPPSDFINYGRLYTEFGENGVSVYNLMRAGLPLIDLKNKLGAEFRIITNFIEKENIVVSGTKNSELYFESGFTNEKPFSSSVDYKDLNENKNERTPRFKVFFSGLCFDPAETSGKFRTALINYVNGDYDAAIGNLSEYIEQRPYDKKGYYNRGLAFYRVKLYYRAKADFEKVLSFDRNHAGALLNSGNCEYNLQEFDKSTEEYSKAIKILPNSMFLYYNRGLAFCCLQDYEKGVIDFSEGIKLFNFFADIYHIRGLARDYLDDLENAISDYEIAILLNPGFTEAINHLDIARSKLNY